MQKLIPSWRQALAVLLLSLAVLGGIRIPFIHTLEKRLLDFSFVIRGYEKPHPDIVIVEVNDQSLKRIGSWPWPRSFHAAILRILQDVEPRVIFFDMLFPETSNPEHDQKFAEAIQKSGNVILSYYFAASNPKEMNQEPEGLPIEILRKGAHGMGYVNSFPDSDGHVREFILRHTYQGKSYEHTSLAAAALYQHWSPNDLERFPADRPFLINFPGPYHSFQVIPYEFLASTYGMAWAKPIHESLRNKIVLIGHTASGTAMDLKPTPFSNLYPGVATQASMIHTLISNRFITPLPSWIHFLLVGVFTFLILTITRLHNPLRGVLYSGACLLILFLISEVAFKYFRIWIPYGSFLFAGALIYLSNTLMSFIKVQFEREIMSRELSLASRIQKNLLPTEMPKIPGMEIAAVSYPARHVGGDLYDVVSLPDGRCGVCIGDVSGKGVPAALFMARSLSEFRREISALEPQAVVKGLNQRLSEGGFSGLFVTLLYLLIHPSEKKIFYANGGHEPIFHYRKSLHRVDLLKTEQGGPLGIDAEGVFDQKETAVESGDILLLESDGVKEAMNPRNDLFGFERIQTAMLEASEKDVKGVIAHLEKRLKEFVKDAPQHDDLTIVCIKFN